MGSSSRRRRRGGHPAKVAARREWEGAQRTGGAPKNPLRRAAAAACREAARVGSALEAELWASALLGLWWPPPPDLLGKQPDLELGGPLVEEIARVGDGGAVAALIAVGELCESELGGIARDRASVLRAAGVPAPGWSEAILEAEILRTVVMREDVFEDGFTVFVEAARGDGEHHTVGVCVDNNLGVMAKDILVADSIERVEEVMRRHPAGGGELRIEPIEPAEAGARIHAAMALTDMTLQPLVGEDYAPLRALALLRADELPGGKVGVSVPEVSIEERERMLRDFLASAEGADFEPGSDEAQVVALAIDFCADYVDGRPLRWSPVVVELFMADWLPRKLLADRAMFEAVPSALEAWVRYAGRVRDVPDWAIAKTVEAIPAWTDEMLGAASGGGGPAKEFLAAAMEAGVDVRDERAFASFIAGWNANSQNG